MSGIKCYTGPLTFPAVVGPQNRDPALTAEGEWFYDLSVPEGSESGSYRPRVLVPRKGFFVNSSVPQFAPKHHVDPSLVVEFSGPPARTLYDAAPENFGSNNSTEAYRARREVIAKFHSEALDALAALQTQEMRANFWARIQRELASESPADIRDALKGIGKFDEVANEGTGERVAPTLKQRLGALLNKRAMRAVADVLKEVALALESKGPTVERLGKYRKGEREALTKNMVMSNGGHFSDMHSGIVTSSLPGGCKDNAIDALLRHWSQWRPVVLECLPDVQESMREALGDEEA